MWHPSQVVRFMHNRGMTEGEMVEITQRMNAVQPLSHGHFVAAALDDILGDPALVEAFEAAWNRGELPVPSKA